MKVDKGKKNPSFQKGSVMVGFVGKGKRGIWTFSGGRKTWGGGLWKEVRFGAN